MSGKYVPMDLAFEHYSHVRQDFNAQEYSKICREMIKDRYSVVNESQAYELFFKGDLALEDKVRVIWLHDIERPNDNFLALKMAEMEHDFGFSTSYNIRMISVAEAMWMDELYKIRDLGHEFQYQHEDLVICNGDQTAAIASFRSNMAKLRAIFPEITLAFGHGVYKSGIDSSALVRNSDGTFNEDLIKACGLPPSGELYCFFDRLEKTFGDRYFYAVESRCIGGDEFVQALQQRKAGDVIVFLQHPTWWSSNYDFEELKYIIRKSKYFH